MLGIDLLGGGGLPADAAGHPADAVRQAHPERADAAAEAGGQRRARRSAGAPGCGRRAAGRRWRAGCAGGGLAGARRRGAARRGRGAAPARRRSAARHGHTVTAGRSRARTAHRGGLFRFLPAGTPSSARLTSPTLRLQGTLPRRAQDAADRDGHTAWHVPALHSAPGRPLWEYVTLDASVGGWTRGVTAAGSVEATVQASRRTLRRPAHDHRGDDLRVRRPRIEDTLDVVVDEAARLCGASPARSRARSSIQVSGQSRPAATTSTSQAAAATCNQISRGQRQARKPPNTPEGQEREVRPGRGVSDESEAHGRNGTDTVLPRTGRRKTGAGQRIRGATRSLNPRE